MRRPKIALTALLGLLLGCANAPAEGVSGPWGQVALGWVEKLCELGPRYPGSEGHQAQQELIVTELESRSDRVTVDSWQAQTPRGPLPMANLIARFGPEEGKIVVISGHHDTMRRDHLPNFVGANDGGSSAAVLLTLAQRFGDKAPSIPVWLVFFDGEEAQIEWQGDDNTYGSRRLAAQWRADGTAERIRALINVDMIGDADLVLTEELYSTAWLREFVWETAREAGYSGEFSGPDGYIADDHVPFADAGIPALDLIDFSYGPGNRYWHTEQDTPDKLSARSLGVIIDVLDRVIGRLAQ